MMPRARQRRTAARCSGVHYGRVTAWVRIAIVLAWSGLAAAGVAAQPLTVAAASDLQPVLPALAARFERESGHTVRLTFGSSGNFFTQIQNGAPFDVLLSADLD